MSAATPKQKPARRLIKRLIAAPFVFIAAILILLEDWLWDDLARLAAAIGRLPVFHQIETLITNLPPYAALFCFAVPSLLLIPVKLVALYFISHGHALSGLLTVIGAKVAGTALVARLFTLTRPRLLRINWFAWVYERFVAFKARIYAVIHSTAIYQAAHRQMVRLRLAFAAWKAKRKGAWRRRWDAARKLSRQRNSARE
ncbi:MAG TPA: hypothetical protein VKA60_16450 [Blastocatellia bacterium]|nr:hypothetical protein [Blastocatellia bacterium]